MDDAYQLWKIWTGSARYYWARNAKGSTAPTIAPTGSLWEKTHILTSCVIVVNPVIHVYIGAPLHLWLVPRLHPERPRMCTWLASTSDHLKRSRRHHWVAKDRRRDGTVLYSQVHSCIAYFFTWTIIPDWTIHSFVFFLFRFLHAISMGGNVGKLVFTYV